MAVLIDEEPKSDSAFDQAESDRAEVATVKSHYKEAKGDKERFSKKWGLFWRLQLGKHWPDSQQNDLERSRPVIQKVYQVTQGQLAQLTNRRPSIRVFPLAADKSGAAEIKQKVLDSVWTSLGIDWLRSLSVKNNLVVGVGFLKVLWDDGARGGKGDIDVQVVDPHNIFISPGCVDLEAADYVIHAQNVTLSRLHRMYHNFPEIVAKLAMVKPGIDDVKLDVDVLAEVDQSTVKAQAKGTDGTGDSGKVYQGPADVLSSGKDQSSEKVTVYEEWSKRDDGSVYVRVVVNDVLIDSYSSPYNDEMYPFVLYASDPSTISIWAQGTVSVVAGLQLTINKLYAQVLDILRLTGNPILLVPAESGIDIQSIKVKPGLVLSFNAGESTRPSWLAPAALPGEIFAAIQYFSHSIDEITNNQDVLQGKTPPGVEAARAIEALASQANVRIERQAQWLERGDHKLGLLLLSRIGQYFTDERVILTMGEDGMATPVSINQQQMQSDGSSMILNQITDDAIQLSVETGPSLPAVRLAEFQKTMLLAQQGAFGPPMLPNGMVNPIWQREIFKAANVPNYKQIMGEVQSMMGQVIQMMMQAQMQAAQAQGAAPVRQAA